MMTKFSRVIRKCYLKQKTVIFREHAKKVFVLVLLFSVSAVLIWTAFSHISRQHQEKSRYKHALEEMGVPIIADASPWNKNPPKQRLVHLDLKGAPPKISYLKQLVRIFKSLGATGLLIEYEDMFPYQKPIEQLSASNAYTQIEVQELLLAATSAGLSVMPLIQTFGHMEFALKHKNYQHLREKLTSPDSICPSLKESMDLIEHMLTQMIDMHLPIKTDEYNWPNFTHLHIGCDEVYNMRKCSRCKTKPKHQLFISHIRNITNFIRSKWPHLKVVIWDDMLRLLPLNELQESQLGNLVEPMVWAYDVNFEQKLGHEIWTKYASVFPSVWAASSFKGSSGETAILPPLRKHLENHLQWMATMNVHSYRFKNGFQGIALTGWQRYNHFLGLCELFPASLPSLAISLDVSSLGYFEPDYMKASFLLALSCPQPNSDRWIEFFTNEINTFEYKVFRKCAFPGKRAMEFSIQLYSITTEAQSFLTRIYFDHSFLSNYAVKHGFGSPNNIESTVKGLTPIETRLHELRMNAGKALSDYYDEYTINEIVDQKITPLIDSLSEVKQNAEYLLSIQIWPRRPLH